MRAAVVSDIHANLHALEAALAAIDEEAPDEIWCLGDLVGYGPRPNECCSLIAERADVCLCGNHDLAVLGALDLAEFGEDAGIAARWTRPLLTAASREFLERLEPQGSAHGVALYHGSARDPVWEYVLSDEAAVATIELADVPLALVGHSHVALSIAIAGDALDGGLAAAGTELELAGRRALVNPGSVGQPRDGDPRAAWVLLDLEAQRASFRRVDYDVAATQEEMRAADLPEFLTARLAFGQ